MIESHETAYNLQLYLSIDEKMLKLNGISQNRRLC